jgi:hypothetical protein
VVGGVGRDSDVSVRQGRRVLRAALRTSSAWECSASSTSVETVRARNWGPPVLLKHSRETFNLPSDIDGLATLPGWRRTTKVSALLGGKCQTRDTGSDR